MVRAIHPLYAVALLLMFLMYMFVQTKQTEQKLQQEIERYYETKTLAQKLQTLQKKYTKATSKKLQKILSSKLLSSKVKLKQKGKSALIEAKSLQKEALNYLFGALLNGGYRIVSFVINKEPSSSFASVKMEIRW